MNVKLDTLGVVTRLNISGLLQKLATEEAEGILFCETARLDFKKETSAPQSRILKIMSNRLDVYRLTIYCC